MVSDVLPRRSELSDPAIANVDHIMLVFSLADPPFEPTTVTRFLVTAEQVCRRILLDNNEIEVTTSSIDLGVLGCTEQLQAASQQQHC